MHLKELEFTKEIVQTIIDCIEYERQQTIIEIEQGMKKINDDIVSAIKNNTHLDVVINKEVSDHFLETINHIKTLGGNFEDIKEYILFKSTYLLRFVSQCTKEPEEYGIYDTFFIQVEIAYLEKVRTFFQNMIENPEQNIVPFIGKRL